MFRRWMRRIRSAATTDTTDASVPPEPAKPQLDAAPGPDDLANPVIERLVEDETLRGDLTDDGYLPLQNWAIARIRGVARAAAHHPDPEAAMERFAGQMRAFVRAAVQAAQAGALGDLAAQVRPRVVREQDVPAVVDALAAITFTDDADANARAIAGAMSNERATEVSR